MTYEDFVFLGNKIEEIKNVVFKIMPRAIIVFDRISKVGISFKVSCPMYQTNLMQVIMLESIKEFTKKKYKWLEESVITQDSVLSMVFQLYL